MSGRRVLLAKRRLLFRCPNQHVGGVNVVDFPHFVWSRSCVHVWFVPTAKSRSDLDLDLKVSKYGTTADRMSASEIVTGWAGGGLWAGV